MVEYALYKGENFLFIGTAEECAEQLKVAVETVKFYATRSYRSKVAKKDSNNMMIAVKLPADEYED